MEVYTSVVSTPEERLRARIERHGPLPFSEFMEEALYGEGGYYATPTPRIGAQGDFVTGSSLSPLFGRSTARLLQRLSHQLGRADFLEGGFGNGRHLEALVGSLPPAFEAGLLAWDRVVREAPRGVEVVADLESVGPLTGLLFSYELFDALPCDRLRWTGEGWEEVRVGLEEEALCWKTVPATTAVLEPFSRELADTSRFEPGQIVDLARGWRPLYRQLAERLGRGLLVTCDYGFERERLFDARVRRHGTVACYRRQTVHRDPFVDIGSQDLTAHVDFTTLIEEGEAAGLETIAVVSQAEWLGACGVFEALEEAPMELRLEAAQLLNPEGMGTAIRVLVQARDASIEGLFDLPLTASGQVS